MVSIKERRYTLLGLAALLLGLSMSVPLQLNTSTLAFSWKSALAESGHETGAGTEKSADGNSDEEVFTGEDGDAGDQGDTSDLSEKIDTEGLSKASDNSFDENDSSSDPTIESNPDDEVSRFSGLSTVPSDQENRLLGNWGDE